MPRVFYEEESDEEPQVPVAAAAAMGGQQSTSDDDDVVMTFDNAAAAGYLPSNFAKDVNRRERARMVMMESPVFMGDLRKDGKRPDAWAERIPATMVQSAGKRHKARMDADAARQAISVDSDDDEVAAATMRASSSVAAAPSAAAAPAAAVVGSAAASVGAAAGVGAAAVVGAKVLDAHQQRAVTSALSGKSVGIFGGAGRGKSLVLTEIVNQYAKAGKLGELVLLASTHVALRNLMKMVRDGCGVDVLRSLLQGGQFMTLNKALGVLVGDPWTEASILNNLPDRRGHLFTKQAVKMVLIDEVGQADPWHLNLLNRVARARRDGSRVCGGLQYVLCGDALQNAPIPGSKEVREPNLVFFFDSELMAAGVELDVVALSVVYRQSCARTQSAFAHIMLGDVNDEVEDFFRATEAVDLSGVPWNRVYHLLYSNQDVERFGLMDYSTGDSNGSDTLWVFRAKKERGGTDISYPQKQAFNWKFGFTLAVRVGEVYTYVSSDEPIEIDGVWLRPRERLRCVEFNRQAETIRMECIDLPGTPQVPIGTQRFHAKPWGVGRQRYHMTVVAFPLRYERVRTVFSTQGMEFDYTHVHMSNMKGKNVVYTAVTRARRGPWEGGLKTTGAFDGGDEALMGKIQAHAKSLVFGAERLGVVMDPAKLEQAKIDVASEAQKDAWS